MKISLSVANFLYNGILQQIEFIQEHLEFMQEFTIDMFVRDICEALAFYKTECVLSIATLEAKYVELAEKVCARKAVLVAAKEVTTIDETE